ncbi:formylglycine-generating enzyme family protein [Dendronalium phyllosphericum]|nr:formylglycine-generating enzyme family protein [Dendronalium phyllosphericum]
MIVINRTQKTAQYYVENLGNDIGLEMVLIPGGSFLMGSPKDELERYDSETPQHSVNIQQFCIGKYPITQEQWRAVAALPQISRQLKPDPSEFKGDKRPVERVSWYDAVEFCDRLTAHTKRNYRLPSEAEWEYACRAGTTTPFHFGETITTDVANYRGMDNEKEKWSGSYGRGTKGIYRAQTTEVGSFKVANAYGLYDMHGNVWEWCADHWQTDYQGAPINGGAWLTTENNSLRLLRGGSWRYVPAYCRSAHRNSREPNSRFSNIGLRVVCDIFTASPQHNPSLQDNTRRQASETDSKKISNNYLPNSQFGGGLINADTVNAERIGGDINNVQGDNNQQRVSNKTSNFNLQNAQFAGGLVNADTVNAGQIGGNITNYNTEERQNLAQAAAEIQQLLNQLSHSYPTATTSEKMSVVARAVDEIESNPTLKARVIGALKAGGTEAFKDLIDHPLVNILLASIDEWQEAE